MAFKNALKILVARFNLAWTLALFMLVLSVIVVGLSLIVIFPVINAMQQMGMVESTLEIISGIWKGDTQTDIWQQIKVLIDQFYLLFSENSKLTQQTIISFFLCVLVYRFILGFYELALGDVLNASMSANNNSMSFVNRFVARLGYSVRFVLCKMIYTTVYDAIFYALIGFLIMLFSSISAFVLIPSTIILLFVIFSALRYTFICMWSCNIVAAGGRIRKSFLLSLKKSTKNFGSCFSNFTITWLLIVALNIFIGIFTFGVGLIATIPISMLFISILNMTLYYNKMGLRYYCDEEIITPLMPRE